MLRSFLMLGSLAWRRNRWLRVHQNANAWRTELGWYVDDVEGGSKAGRERLPALELSITSKGKRPRADDFVEACLVERLDRDWIVRCRVLQQHAGQPVIIEVHVLPVPEGEYREGTDAWAPGVPFPAGGVPARLLRHVRLGELQRTARSLIATEVGRQPAELPRAASWREGEWQAFLDERWQVSDEGLQGARRPGARGAKLDVLARVIVAYLRALERGVRAPRAWVAKELNYSPATVGGHLVEIRRLGLLTKPGPGVAGGELTSKGRRFLADHGFDPEQLTRFE